MCVCLSRYYPYHYAPFLSDIRNISELKLTFDLEKPFMPFQQLLAVLPAASKELLPESYRVLFGDFTYKYKYRKMCLHVEQYLKRSKYWGLCNIQT